MANPNSCPVCESAALSYGQKLNGYSIPTCSNCELSFAIDALDVDTNYDTVYDSAEYQESQVTSFRGAGTFEEFVWNVPYRHFFKQVTPAPGHKMLLDIGCGVGRFCHAAKLKGWDVHGLDVSQRAVGIAMERANFPVYCGTLDDHLLLGEHLYNAVTAFEVLEHLDDPRSFLMKAAKAIAPGGSIFCTVPNWDCPTVKGATKTDWLPPIHKLFFTRRSLQALFEQAGYRVLEVGYNVTEPLPIGLRDRLRWLKRRLKGKERAPLGLWIHAKPETVAL